jgi:hypothetical protein
MIIVQVLIDAIMRHHFFTYRTGNRYAFLLTFITIRRKILYTRRPLLRTNPPINLVLLPPRLLHVIGCGNFLVAMEDGFSRTKSDLLLL